MSTTAHLEGWSPVGTWKGHVAVAKSFGHRREQSVPCRSGRVYRQGSRGAQTNDLGEFRLFGLAPGEVYVQATSRPDFGRSASPRPTVLLATYFPGTADVVGAMPITLAAGQTSGEITIRMVSAPAFEVSGVVTDEGGRPVENALVRLAIERAPGDPPMPFSGGIRPARSDKAGRFTIGGVVTGSYTLLAIAPVLLSTRDAALDDVGGIGASASFTSGTVTVGLVGGFVGGGVTTETLNGVTIQKPKQNRVECECRMASAGARVTHAVLDVARFQPTP
jgi:hypothetical protein